MELVLRLWIPAVLLFSSAVTFNALAATSDLHERVFPPPFKCGTLEQLKRRGFEIPSPNPIETFGREKTERDAYGVFPNVILSPNFALKWGDESEITTEQAQTLIDTFETVWTMEVDTFEYPPPTGSDLALFNVYIGDTGSPAPSAQNFGGYFAYDPENWPMIVVAMSSAEDPLVGEVVSSHEFFHAIQLSTGNYLEPGIEDASSWYLEATAVWMETEVFLNNPTTLFFALYYLFTPHIPVFYFDYPDTGVFLEYHCYGAMLFPLFLATHVADSFLIRDSWLQATPNSNPLLVLSSLLESSHGVDMTSSFSTFAARNAVLDYTFKEIMEYYADYVVDELEQDDFRDNDFREIGAVGKKGTNGFVLAPLDTLPRNFGYNVVRIEPNLDDAMVRVGFKGEPYGTQGSVPSFGVNVVSDLANAVSYIPIELEDHAGEVWIEQVAAHESLFLVVAVTSDSFASAEKFPFAYEVEIPGQGNTGTEDEQDTGGCTCSVGQPANPFVSICYILLLIGFKQQSRRRNNLPTRRC